MPFLIVRHRVRDYAAWRRIYDDDVGKRPGTRGEWVMLSEKDPSEVVVVLHVESLADTRQYIFDDLGAKMRAAGVAEPPRIEYFEDAPPL